MRTFSVDYTPISIINNKIVYFTEFSTEVSLMKQIC